MNDRNESISNLKYNLNYYGADYPVDSLVKRMQEEEFIFPDFQRKYVWSLKEASKFIESLLIGLPVPSIFLAKDKYSSKLIVIDGQQRLRTLQYFFEGKLPDGREFKLKNVIDEIEGKTYQDLSSEDRFNFHNTIIHCLIVSENEKSDGIFYLFERLNTTGNPLTNQEVRNAIYHGEFNNLLLEFSRTSLWKSLYHKEELRLNDQELILRFLAFSFELNNYKGNLNEFLNSFMRENRNFENIPRRVFEKRFFETMELIVEIYGNNAFYKNKQFNRSLFETLSLFITFTIEKDKVDKMKLKQFYDNLIKDEDFWELTKSATTSRKSIESRLEYANNLFDKI